MRLTSRSEWKRLADVRRIDAELLLANRRWSSAFYLAGYAIECGLKAVICKQFPRSAIPEKKFVNDIYVHDLASLRRLANLDSIFRSDMLTSPGLEASWAIVKDWSEQARYVNQTETVARDMLAAVTDPVSGVLIWLRRYY